MDPQIIQKLLAYAKEHEIKDAVISQKGGRHLLEGDNGLKKYQLKLPAGLEVALGRNYRRLLALAPDDLVSGAYVKDHGFSYRLSVIPDGSGEKIVVNAVTKTGQLLPLSHLGFGREAKQLVENFLKRRRGLIIVAGGDNQGKTTTLYALLDRINRDKRLCYALEKYSEISLNGLNKIKVRPDRRAAALDRLLKTDSDVIMADDVDDRLLGSAVAASRTGRLILVGYKTERLADLVALVRSLNRRGDPPILLLQQQLLDRNCPHCLEAYAANGWEEFLDKYWPENKRYRPRRFFTSRGCPRCHYSGTKGRIASFNLVRIDERQVNLVSALATDTLEKAANGLVSLRHWLDHKLEKEK